jgi:hypothetical protein
VAAVAARIVCISRTLAAGREEVGRLVANGLGFRLLDEQIVARAAKKAGLDPEQVADAERRKSFSSSSVRSWDGAAGRGTPTPASPALLPRPPCTQMNRC